MAVYWRSCARLMHAEDLRHELPPAGVFRGRRQRPTPDRFGAEAIHRVVTYARRLGPPGSWRPSTSSPLFGVLAATGMRPAEARALQLCDLTPDGRIIRDTTFKTSRLLPLHDTTGGALQDDLDRRRRVAGPAPHLFVSHRGGPRSYSVMVDTFDDVIKAAGMPREAGTPRPRRMEVRHTVAVRGLATCPAHRDQVGHPRLALTTSRGHAQVESPSWYLERTPAWMADMARPCEAFVDGGARCRPLHPLSAPFGAHACRTHEGPAPIPVSAMPTAA